jgi:hypothetical protein
MRAHATWFAALGVIAAAACGGDDGPLVSPGDGSRTLLVDARIEYDDGGAEIWIEVVRAGQQVTGADVSVSSGLGAIDVPHLGSGFYGITQAGWEGPYVLSVDAGDDWLDAAIDAPAMPAIVSPAPGVAIEPRADEDGVIEVEWAGELAHRVAIDTHDFEWQGIDEGSIAVPATAFDEDEQDIEIERTNSTALEGGAPGSELRVRCGTRQRFSVIDPF